MGSHFPELRFSLLVAFALCVSAGVAAPLAGSGLRLSVDASPEERDAVQNVAALCQARIVGLFRDDPEPSQPIVIRIAANLPTPADPLTLHFDPLASLPVLTHRLTGALLLRRAREMPAGEQASSASLDWLSAAVTFRVLNGLGIPLFGAPGAWLPAPGAGANLPRVKKILGNSIPPDLAMPYALYARYCNVYLTVLERADRPDEALMHRVFELVVAGRSAITALQFGVSNLLNSDETVDQWFERELLRQSRTRQRHASVEQITARLQELETLPMVGTSELGAFGVKRVSSEEILAKGKDYKLDREGLGRLYRALFDIFRDAPVLLQPSINLRMQAVEALMAGRQRAFRHLYGEARKEYDQATVRQRQLEEVLDKLESESTEKDRALSFALQPLVEASSLQRRNLDPELQQYLDSVR